LFIAGDGRPSRKTEYTDDDDDDDDIFHFQEFLDAIIGRKN